MTEKANEAFDDRDQEPTLPMDDLADAGQASNLEQLLHDLEDARERALRTQADLDNVRKRMRREMEEERRFASQPLINDLLPVVDNVGRAIEAAEKANESGSLLEGFKMVANQLNAALAKHNCQVIEALGKPFDPHLHEAILQQPSAEHPPGTVIMVVQTGYQLHERVLRPTQVIVSSAPA
jgi:molecular chaperone GrpE